MRGRLLDTPGNHKPHVHAVMHRVRSHRPVKRLGNLLARLPNVQADGFGADCSSYPELLLAEHVGIVSEKIMFTSNDTPAHEFQKARSLGAIINLDDISHLSFLERHAGVPELICFRYNPGPRRTGNAIIDSSPTATVEPETITERPACAIVSTSADSMCFPSRSSSRKRKIISSA